MSEAISTDKANLLRELAGPATAMAGLSAIKTRYRPLVCPLHLVLEAIEPGIRLYDVGCGSGALMYLALRLRRVALAHGYDVSYEAVHASEAFARHDGEFRVVRLAPDATPPDLAGYDTVTMVDVLHHIPPSLQAAFLTRLIANMASGAQLVLLDIDASRKIGAWCNQLHDVLLAREWVHPMRPERVADVLSAAGAEVGPTLRCRTLWYPHYRIVARKP
jgi:cyclopropane fatty-acyl-phospholipid synthase-like methyltransferase